MVKITTLIITLFLSTTSFAEKWPINRDHSEIFFSVSYLGVSEVTGRFHNFRGFLDINQDNRPIYLKILLSVDSIETGNKLRDGHLRGSDFFQKNQFPEIIFEAKTIIPKPNNIFVAKGVLQIKAISKPYIVEFSLSSPVKDTWNYLSRFAKFKTVINRSHFSMKWNKTLEENKYLVGENVTVWGALQLQPQNNKTPKNNHMIPDTKYIRERERVYRGEIKSREESAVLSSNDDGRNDTKEINKSSVKKVVQKDKKGKTRLWWIAFFILGLMGFVSVIVISVYTKSIVTGIFNSRSKKDVLADIISDALLICWVLLYSTALWITGWGT